MAQSKTTNSKTKSGGRDSAKKAPAKSARASKTKEEKAREKAEEQLLAAQLQENLRRKKQIKDNIAAVAFISVGVFFIVSLYTNSTGSVGAALQGVLNGLFGRAVSLVIGVFLALFGILIFARKTAFLTLRTWLSIAALFISAACLSASREADVLLAMTDVRFREFYATGVDSGGLVGNSLCLLLLRAVGKTGLYLICAVLILVSVMFILNTPISAFFDDILLKAEARRRAREEKAAAEAEGRQLTIDVPKNVPIVPEVIAPDDEPVFASSLSELEPVGEQKAPEEELPVFKLPKDEPARPSRSEARESAASGMLSDEGDPMPPFDLFDSDGDGITDNQKNILMMVRSDSLFDDKPKPRSNFGLNGDSLIQTERPSIAAPEKTGPEPGSFEDIFGVSEPVGKGASAKSSSGKGLGDEGASPAPQAEAADQAAAGGSGSAKAASASASGASDTPAKKASEPSYKFPPITLLGKNSSVVGGANGNLWDQAELLESTLASFG
ncbi:MAG: DNA translocase FtsK 4TM domain-containing protein, partial [Firmicutes bacterium]|nr:DNA translocase FtsK 4TM domain-containing protein [Bacillota bacterium]